MDLGFQSILNLTIEYFTLIFTILDIVCLSDLTGLDWPLPYLATAWLGLTEGIVMLEARIFTSLAHQAHVQIQDPDLVLQHHSARVLDQPHLQDKDLLTLQEILRLDQLAGRDLERLCSLVLNRNRFHPWANRTI